MRIRMLLAAMALIGLPFVLPEKAHAACASIPYTFTNSTGTYSTVDANTTNSNNAALRACATNVDNTQIGSNGIFASQIIPTTVASATFGGTISYTFPLGVSLSGQTVQAIATPGSGTSVAGIAGTNLCGYNGVAYAWCLDTNGNAGLAGGVFATLASTVRGGYVSPIVNAGSASVASGQHTVYAQGTCSSSPCTPITVSFSGAVAPFTSTTSYYCALHWQDLGAGNTVFEYTNTSATSSGPNGTAIGIGAGTYHYLIVCEGW